jgi:hypothetical protein
MAFLFCRLIDIDGKLNGFEKKDWIMGSGLRRLDDTCCYFCFVLFIYPRLLTNALLPFILHPTRHEGAIQTYGWVHLTGVAMYVQARLAFLFRSLSFSLLLPSTPSKSMML